MELEIYHWLVPLLAISFMIRVFVQYRQGNRKLRSVFIWLGVTLFISGIAILPDELSVPMARLLGFKSHINAVIFVSLGILFGINYSQSMRLSRMERKLADLVRALAKDSPHIPPES